VFKPTATAPRRSRSALTERPAGDVPHKFTNDDPERSKLICIHANPTMITEWLE